MIPTPPENCMNNIVAFNQHCATANTLFTLQQLQGISTRFADNVADSDHQAAKSVFDNALFLAFQHIKSQLITTHNHILKKGREDCLCDLPQDLNGVVWKAEDGLGVTVKFIGRSDIKQNTLQSIKVLSKNSGVYQAKIQDKGGVYYYPITLVADAFAELSIGHIVTGDWVKITFDNTVTLGGFSCKNGGKGCNCGSNKKKRTPADEWFRITGTDNSPSVIWGIQPCVESACDGELMLCKFREELGLALLYRAGYNMLLEAALTERYNITTIKNAEARAATAQEWVKTSDSILGRVKQQIDEYIKRGADSCYDCKGLSTGWAVH
jgi:hypothetical protein